MASPHTINRVAPPFALHAGAGSPVTLEHFQRQPIVLAFCDGEDAEAWADGEALDDVRAQLRGLGAVLVMVLDTGIVSLGPDDEIQRWEAGDAGERARLRARYGVAPGGAGIFVVDGDLMLRLPGTTERIRHAGVLAHRGRITPSEAVSECHHFSGSLHRRHF